MIMLKRKIRELELENSEFQSEIKMYKDISFRQNQEIDQLNKNLNELTVELSTKHEEIERLQEELNMQAEHKLIQMEEFNKTKEELTDTNYLKDRAEQSTHERILEIQSLKDKYSSLRKENSIIIKEKEQISSLLETKRHELVVCY